MLKPNDRTFTADLVRLIGPDGEQLGVVPYPRARELAQEAGEDLVLVSDRSTPPVVRIMNFGKLQYEQKKNLKAQRRNSAAQKLKEVKFHINIDDHDYQTKLKHALDFLEKGCRLKVTLALRGREMAHTSIGEELLKKFGESCAEVANVEKNPKLDGRHMSMFLSPKNAK